MEIITQSAKETQKLGEKIGRDLKKESTGPQIIALYGELGGGKTTFIQGLARGLGIKNRVLSPTFVFMRQYQFDGGVFSHVDLYRIESINQAKGLGLEEIFNDSRAVMAIEWAERIKEILPKKRMEIYFEYVDKDSRRIKIVG